MPDHKAIVGEWIHAHERDAGGVRVFVPAGNPLPPSRGRRKLVLRADGTFEDTQPGADDRSGSQDGQYRFDGRQLTLSYAKSGTKPATYNASLNPDGTTLEIGRTGDP